MVSISDSFRMALLMNVLDYEQDFTDTNKRLKQIRANDIAEIRSMVMSDKYTAVQLHLQIHLYLKTMKTGFLWFGKSVVPTGRSQLKKNIVEVLKLYIPKRIARMEAEQARLALIKGEQVESNIIAEQYLHAPASEKDLLQQLQQAQKNNTDLQLQNETMQQELTELRLKMQELFVLHKGYLEKLDQQQQEVTQLRSKRDVVIEQPREVNYQSFFAIQ